MKSYKIFLYDLFILYYHTYCLRTSMCIIIHHNSWGGFMKCIIIASEKTTTVNHTRRKMDKST